MIQNFLFWTFIIMTLPISIPMNFFIRSDRGDRIGEKLPYRPRILNWVWATWGGLFWDPCCLCGRNYGGHEGRGNLMLGWDQGVSVCPRCAEEAERRNEKFVSENPPPMRSILL